MKTPREVLLARHRLAESQLDAIREAAVAVVREHRNAGSTAATFRHFNIREFLFSLRWHLAGMSAVWLAVALLNLNAGHSSGRLAAVSRGKIPSAQIILASLRENRRELLEMIQPSESRDARPEKSFPIPPRSNRQSEILAA